MERKIVAIIVLLILSVVILSGCTGQQVPTPTATPTPTPPSEKIIFSPLAELTDATAGSYYEYSFCKPNSSISGATCGGLAGATTDPTGGNPPYSFSVEFGAGFLPPGLALELNGLLRGTPTLPGTYTFGICASDGKDEDCATTSLTVKSKPENNLSGLWESIEYGNMYKITQTGKDVVITFYQVGPSYTWQGDPGDIIAEGTFDGNKITGRVTLYPQKGNCIGYTWSGDYGATVSEDGKTINVIYGYNRYNVQTCQTITNSAGKRSETYTRIE
jgi:hypothetical protein